MNDERDPRLQSLFAQAREDLDDRAFTVDVMARVEGLRRRSALAWIGVDLLIVLAAWLLAKPLQEAVAFIMPRLTASLVELDNPVLADWLLPVNSLAGLAALAFFLLRSVYRRHFRPDRRSH